MRPTDPLGPTDPMGLAGPTDPLGPMGTPWVTAFLFVKFFQLFLNKNYHNYAYLSERKMQKCI